jgi:hypothetical protein
VFYLRRGVVYTLDCFLMPLPRSRFSSAYVAWPFVFFSFGHCVICSSLIYGFWLPLWYLLVIVLSVLWFTGSDYPFGIFWSLCCLFFDLHVLITPLVSFGHCVVCSLVYRFWLPIWYLLVIVLSVLWFTSSDYPFDIFKLFLLFFVVVSASIGYNKLNKLNKKYVIEMKNLVFWEA